MTPDGEVIDRIERAELFAEQLCGVIEAVAAGPCPTPVHPSAIQGYQVSDSNH